MINLLLLRVDWGNKIKRVRGERALPRPTSATQQPAASSNSATTTTTTSPESKHSRKVRAPARPRPGSLEPSLEVGSARAARAGSISRPKRPTKRPSERLRRIPYIRGVHFRRSRQRLAWPTAFRLTGWLSPLDTCGKRRCRQVICLLSFGR